MATANPTDEMLEALRANIEYLKTVGDSQVRIRNGELIDVQAELFIYLFELDVLQDLDTDSEIEVRVKDQSATGKVVSLNDNKLQIQLDTNLGPKVSEAMLIVSSYFLLERLSEFIEQVKDKENSLSDKAIGQDSPATGSEDSYVVPLARPPLNDSQKAALKFVLGSDVSYIWGPPGTGKTQTIASIVQGFIAKGYSTLLISHTNTATDTALEKVVEYLKDTEDYHEGRFLRVGKVSKKLAQYKVVPEVILAEKVKPIMEEIEANRQELATLTAKLRASRAAHFMMAEKDELDENVEQLTMYFDEKKEEFKQRRDYVSSLQSQLQSINGQIEEHQNKGAFSKMFSGTSLQKLTEQKSAILREGGIQKNVLIDLKSELEETQTQLKDAEQKVKEYEERFKSEGLLSDEEEEKIEKRIKNLNEQQEQLLNEIEKIRDELILNAKVVASTLTMSYTNKKVLSREYDCVVLDEASIAPLPAVYSAASIAQKKVVLVGDFYQLPPIAKHEVITKNKTPEEILYEEQLIKQWLKRDVFDLVGITKKVMQQLDAPIMRQLKTQYRMHPDISALINHLVYAPKGQTRYKLEDGQPTHDYGKALLDKEPLKSAHLGFYDTGNIGSVPVKTESGSYYNLSHALLCIELVKKALKNGYKSIGIVSAYRAQVNLLSKMIDDTFSKDEKQDLIADTVHRFQGDEKQLIIFDVTTPKSPSMYDDYGEGGDDMKLMNVAFSRAKEKCVIVADIKAVKKRHSETSLVMKTITYCEAKAYPLVQAEQVLPHYVADDRTEQWLAKLNMVNLEKEVSNVSLFDETDFYPAFLRDLLKAEKEVVICSPFITSFRAKQFRPFFNLLIERGVRIFLITKPPDAHKDSMKEVAKTELKQLEAIGVTVLPIIGVHEKVALIDREILYEGSLNILSQRDSSELMHRFKGTNVAQQLAGFLKIDKNIGPVGENRLKHCEVCKDTGAWYWTAKGLYGRPWTFCLANIHAPGKEPKTRAERAARRAKKASIRQTFELNAEGVPLCPVHNVATALKRGPFGEFYGCPQHRECGFAVSKAKVEKLAKA